MFFSPPKYDRLPTRHSVITDRDQLLAFASDQSEMGPFVPDAVIRLSETADENEIAGIIRHCARHKIPVTPQGGLTGLTGGALPEKGGLVLSCVGMKGIEVDPVKKIAIVKPGAIISEVHAAAEAVGLFYPPDPTSLDGCTIGGTVANNAGGPRAAKYGVTRHYVADLKVVLPNGDVIHTGKRTVKNTAGYDLTSLFVGSGGTLGFIQEVTLHLLSAPERVQTFLAFFPSVDAAMRCITESRGAGLRPRALEFMDKISVEVARAGGRIQIPAGCEAALLIEEDGGSETVDAAVKKWTQLLDKTGGLTILASTNVKDQADYWALRRRVSPSFKERGYKFTSDFAVPVDQLPAMVSFIYDEAKRRHIREAGVLFGVFGHAADGNLHVNLVVNNPPDDKRMRVCQEFSDAFHRKAIELDGTIAAEHGVGRAKREYLSWQQSAALRAAQLAIKSALDPLNLFNPGNILGKMRSGAAGRQEG